MSYDSFREVIIIVVGVVEVFFLGILSGLYKKYMEGLGIYQGLRPKAKAEMLLVLGAELSVKGL